MLQPSPPAFQAKRDIVRGALNRVGKNGGPRELLQRLGGREIAVMVGAMIEAARLRRVVLVDGFIVSVGGAALICALALRAKLLAALLRQNLCT